MADPRREYLAALRLAAETYVRESIALAVADNPGADPGTMARGLHIALMDGVATQILLGLEAPEDVVEEALADARRAVEGGIAAWLATTAGRGSRASDG